MSLAYIRGKNFIYLTSEECRANDTGGIMPKNNIKFYFLVVIFAKSSVKRQKNTPCMNRIHVNVK